MAYIVEKSSEEKELFLQGEVAFDACERFLMELEAMREIFGDGEFYVNVNSVNLLKSLLESCEKDPAIFNWSVEGIPDYISCKVTTTTATNSFPIEIRFKIPQGYLVPRGPKPSIESIQCECLNESSRKSILNEINNLLLNQWEDECIYNLVQCATERCSEKIELNAHTKLQADALAAEAQQLFNLDLEHIAETSPIMTYQILNTQLQSVNLIKQTSSSTFG